MFGEIVFFKEFASFASKLCKLLSNLVVLNDAQRPRIGDGWAIYNFLLERLPVNEQKVEIFILLLNSVFSAWNYSPIANKKLMKCTLALLLPMRCKVQFGLAKFSCQKYFSCLINCAIVKIPIVSEIQNILCYLSYRSYS
jgi:hypothetical protein